MLGFLALSNVEERLRRGIELFIKHTSISEVTRKIASAVDESLSKQQKEFFLRQQLAAIQRELAILERGGTDPSATSGLGSGRGSAGSHGEHEGDEVLAEDEMADIKRRFETMVVGSEERKMAEREWRRLRRIPQQSAEHGVIQNYVRDHAIFVC